MRLFAVAVKDGGAHGNATPSRLSRWGRSTCTVALLSLTLSLQGCLFFFVVPSSLFDGNNTCLGRTAKVGDTIKFSDGREGKVESIAGASSRCQQPEYPLLAKLAFNPAPATNAVASPKQ